MSYFVYNTNNYKSLYVFNTNLILKLIMMYHVSVVHKNLISIIKNQKMRGGNLN